VRVHGRAVSGVAGRYALFSFQVPEYIQLRVITRISRQCYLAPPEGDDDPAVYRSSRSKKEGLMTSTSNEEEKENGNHVTNGTDAAGPEQGLLDGNRMDEDSEGSENEDDGDTLLTVQPDFNRLLLVLRDERVMRFVKYLSASAQGSRWDVSGEWEIGVPIDEDGQQPT